MQIIVSLYYRKKIEEIGKMTALSQEEILSNTKTVVQVSAVRKDVIKITTRQPINKALSLELNPFILLSA